MGTSSVTVLAALCAVALQPLLALVVALTLTLLPCTTVTAEELTDTAIMQLQPCTATTANALTATQKECPTHFMHMQFGQ
eukprot:6721-Heterococcus_DN1.PRE.2